MSAKSSPCCLRLGENQSGNRVGESLVPIVLIHAPEVEFADPCMALRQIRRIKPLQAGSDLDGRVPYAKIKRPQARICEEPLPTASSPRRLTSWGNL